MSIHGDVADLSSSCRVSLSGLNLDRLPPHYSPQEGTAESRRSRNFSPSLSVRVSSQHNCRFVEESHRFLLLGGGRVHGGGWIRRMSCWAKRRMSSWRRISWNHRGVREHWLKTINRDRVHLVTNLEAVELVPPL